MSATSVGLSATGTLKRSPGKLKGWFVSTASGSPTVAIYDSNAASTSDPKLIDTFVPVAGANVALTGQDGIGFTNGLYVVIAATCSVQFFFE